MTINSILKDPSANLDYDFDWTDWLPDGDTISSSAVTADDGITLGSKQQGDYVADLWTPSATGSVIKQFISAGTARNDYRVTCRITTSESRVDERTIVLMVRDR